jgi:LysR family hydrogen peroxide-inducible transcriptional activator
MTAAPACRAGEGARARARPELNQLVVFVEVAEARSFAAAARKLARTQPAVSQCIARLEEIYGGDLFERRPGSSLRLTMLGEALLPSARLILHTLDHHMADAARAARGEAGTLVLGVHRLFGSRQIGQAIARFSSERPDVRMRFVEASPRELMEQLDGRAIHVLVSPAPEHPLPAGLISERLWAEPVVFAVPKEISCRARPVDSRSRLYAAGTFAGRHTANPASMLRMVPVLKAPLLLFESEACPTEGVTFISCGSSQSVEIHAAWPEEDRNPLRHRFLSLLRQTALL